MFPRRHLEVPIPPGLEIEPAEAELLKATFQALVALRGEPDRKWEGLVHQLEQDGWTVRWGLTWRAEAKRGEEYEEATGATLADALDGVAQLVMTDMVGHTP